MAMRWDRPAVVLCALLVLFGSLPRTTQGIPNDGALIEVTFASVVGFLLDEIPASPQREAAATSLLGLPASAWTDLASKQTALTLHRLHFRRSFLQDPRSGQLPLPPQSLWTFAVGQPVRRTIQNHDYVAVTYTFRSMLVAEYTSIFLSGTALSQSATSSVTEAFVLPVDPTALLARTNFTCLDPTELPLGSVRSVNAPRLYNDGCAGLTASACANQPCPKLLQQRVGYTRVALLFQRLVWDDAVAAQWAVCTPSAVTPDISAYGPNLSDNQLLWEFISPTSCPEVHQCTGAPGWRRLLQFTATALNQGQVGWYVGSAFDPRFNSSNLFRWDTCHGHYHFYSFSEFTFGSLTSAKQGFCVTSTGRYCNNKFTPLSHIYDNCVAQGIAPGWGDDYDLGIPCQWVDVTDMLPAKYKFGIDINPQKVLCEGATKLDPATGTWLFYPAATRSDGSAVYAQQCQYVSNYFNNNKYRIDYTLRGLAVTTITSPCPSLVLSPLRDCGWTVIANLVECTVGALVPLHASVPAAASAGVAIRVCRAMRSFGLSTQCPWAGQLASGVALPGATLSLPFSCPVPLSADDSGAYSVMVSPLLPTDTLPTVTLS